MKYPVGTRVRVLDNTRNHGRVGTVYGYDFNYTIWLDDAVGWDEEWSTLSGHLWGVDEEKLEPIAKTFYLISPLFCKELTP